MADLSESNNRMDDLRKVAQARDRFLEACEPQSAMVRDTILMSWRRSQLSGVDVDRLEPPYSEVDLKCRLLRAAAPVLDRLETALNDTPVSIILTDGKARVLMRRAGDRSLNDHLDSVQLAPGFSYAEEHIGTNGIGTAVEEGKAFHVFGSEHFSERLQTFSCAGAPIRHPFRGGLAGVIDLTCRPVEASPLLAVLAQEAAWDIERRLREEESEGERRLFGEFVTACRRVSKPILGVSDDMFLANSKAAQLIDPLDHAMIREKAAALSGSIAESASEVVLSDGRWATLRCRRFDEGPKAGTGVLVEINVHRGRPRTIGAGTPSATLPGLAGKSAGWTEACRAVERHCRERLPLLLVGEMGVGKLALARAAYNRWCPAGRMRMIDCADARNGAEDWLARIKAALAHEYSAVVLRRLDALDAPVSQLLAALIGRMQPAESGPWIVGTRTAAPSTAPEPDQLIRCFASPVTVPPLRHRIDDVRELVPALLERHAGGRTVSCSPQALQVLLRAPWSGNVAELEKVLRSAIHRRVTGQIQPQDLPPSCFATSRRVLTQLEAMERDAITRALIEARGDKGEAAARLGISRATIYRKIRTYGLVPECEPGTAP